MSATRPLTAMKRVTELTCSQPPGHSRALAAPRQTQPPETATIDEFTVHEEKEADLECAKPRVEQVFEVAFVIIGLLDHSGAHGGAASRQIWLQLRGKKEDVVRAKEYVKGLCDPELQEEERYPVDMHCIFAGARGLFLDRLLRDTSAEVQVLEPGRLKLLGCAEAVVMAQSRVQQFVSLFQEKCSSPSDREPAVKQAFKIFVEDQADKYTMELLLLPSALKEELLGLVQCPPQLSMSVDIEQDRSQTSTPVTELSNRILGATFEDKASSKDKSLEDKAPKISPVPDALVLNGRPNHKRRSSESEQRDTKRQYSLEKRDAEQQDRGKPRDNSETRSRPADKMASESSDEGEAVSPETNLRCLVNFFRTMGYEQDIVEQVVRETGQTQDTFLLLERIDKESQKSQSVSTTANSAPATTSTSTSVRLKEKERVQGRALTEIKLKENIRVPSSNGWSQKSQTLNTITLDSDDDVIEIGRKCRTVGPLDLKSDSRFDYLSRGGAQTVGPIRMETVTPLRSSAAETRPGCSYQTICTWVPPSRTEPPAAPKAIPLTGMSRFHQSLRTPYRLVLQDVPGYPHLRHIIIDGSNVAMAHGLHRVFSCRGIALAVEFFWRRGHREITVFVPQWRQKKDNNVTEQHFLNQLEDLRLLSFTPSREVCGQRISSHDDRFLLHLAEKTGGVIVTNDNLRDFVAQSEAWRKIIQERLLQFTFVEDHFMIPDDPLGKHGPHLEQFLCKDSRSPVMPKTRMDPQPTVYAPVQTPVSTQSRPASLWPHSGPPNWHPPHRSPSPPPQRSSSETTELKRKLYVIFPDQKQRIDRILSDNPYMRDLNALSGLVLG